MKISTKLILASASYVLAGSLQCEVIARGNVTLPVCQGWDGTLPTDFEHQSDLGTQRRAGRCRFQATRSG